MNELEFLVEDKRLTYCQLTLELRRLNILLSIAKDEKIPIPRESLIRIKEKIEKYVSARNLNCLSLDGQLLTNSV